MLPQKEDRNNAQPKPGQLLRNCKQLGQTRRSFDRDSPLARIGASAPHGAAGAVLLRRCSSIRHDAVVDQRHFGPKCKLGLIGRALLATGQRSPPTESLPNLGRGGASCLHFQSPASSRTSRPGGGRAQYFFEIPEPQPSAGHWPVQRGME